MHHVVSQPMTPLSVLEGSGRLHLVPTGTDNLTWLLECVETGAVGVVDGPEAEPVLAYLDANALRLDAVLNTHTHGDHVGLNRELAHAGRLEGVRVIGAALTADRVPGLTEPVHDGDVVRLGALEGQVLRTEGHMNGHVSYRFGEVLFSGDTLFTGGCGRIFDGPPAALFDSLLRLAELDPSTLVCCGHEYTQDNLRFAWSVEPDNLVLAARIRAVWALRAEGHCAVPSRLADEQATNPFLRPGAPSLVERVTEAVGHPLETPLEVFTATRALKDQGAYQTITDEALPLEEPPQ